ncbi:hypothetical protein [Aeromonas phage AerS_266]|nr:hypothetical protein [Aeromonas phage AerS_266]
MEEIGKRILLTAAGGIGFHIILTNKINSLPFCTLTDLDVHHLKAPDRGYKTKMYQPKKNQYLGARAPECFINDKYIHRKGRR